MAIDSKKTGAAGEKLGDRRQVTVLHGEIDSRELFQNEREVRIRHGAETYRLRLTTLNKLILTK
jgi:hemin uptake protein HemP